MTSEFHLAARSDLAVQTAASTAALHRATHGARKRKVEEMSSYAIDEFIRFSEKIAHTT